MPKNIAPIPKRLPPLSDAVPPEKMHRCSCGSYAFFAWGVKVINSLDYPQERFKDMAGYDELLICAKCFKPLVVDAGKLYDASEYVTPEEVERLIQFGQARQHVTPVRAMDP